MNLLDQETQQRIRTEYRLRVGFLASLSVIVTALIYLALLIPSYMKVEEDIAELSQKKKTIEGNLSQEDLRYEQSIKDLNAQIAIMKARPGEQPIALLDTILWNRPPGIQITSYSYDTVPGKPSTLVISGNASTREDLTQYKDRLSQETIFGEVFIPTETLIKKNEIPFNISITLVAPKS